MGGVLKKEEGKEDHRRRRRRNNFFFLNDQHLYAIYMLLIKIDLFSIIMTILCYIYVIIHHQ